MLIFIVETTISNIKEENFKLGIVGLYPLGSPSRNSQRPGSSPGPRGGLEIVFNQQ
ncbi:uncharacterized protein LOC112092745 [Morus notabilis]|uniref:uncharacterized protein LOC112092745 n=1 Tax=Morus notabilis TaxID=981085 RepID=UPI000CECF664|nr:uncharacterized protein LOC112092745 [Morus notabilis]